MTVPNALCSRCGAEVLLWDKFCAACGSRVDRNAASREVPGTLQRESSVSCGLCGHQNAAASLYCESCGAWLGRRAQAGVTVRAASSSGRSSGSGGIIRFLQSWKLTVGLAAAFVVILVIVGTSENARDHVHSGVPGMTVRGGEAMREIEQLQKALESNPSDMESTLRLANLLHDVKFFPRAISMYGRYLREHPANPDARVDLGICYFELALVDSGNRGEFLGKARQEMKKALEYAPRHQLAFFNLGIVSLHAGEIEESNMWLKKCIDADPASETGKRAQSLYNQHQPGFLRD